MDQRLKELLDAQVAFELKRFKGKNLDKLISREVAAAFEWMKDVRLNEVFPIEHVLGIIRREVVELPISGGITELAGEMSRMVLASKANATTTLEDIFPEDIFYEMVEKAAGLDKARKERVQRALYTNAYFRLISDVIVQTVKEFFLADNPVVRKVPGMKFLMKTGRNAAGVAAPSWFGDLEHRLRETLEERMEAVAREKEEFFMDMVNPGRLVEISEEVWQRISPITLDNHFSALAPDDLEDFVVIGLEFWMNFRTTRYFERIYTEIAQAFYEKYGHLEVDVFLEDMGVTQDMVIMEITETLHALAKKTLATGYLEKRIRAFLEPFYRSKKAQAILNSK